MAQHHPGSFQKYRFLQLEELAIKHALYDSVSQSASESFAAAVSSGQDPYVAAKSAAHLRLLEFESSLSSQGYPVLLWCGEPTEGELLRSSELMAGREIPTVPDGAYGIASPACLQSVQVDILQRKLHFSSLGLSYYCPGFGYGVASTIPEGFEVDF